MTVNDKKKKKIWVRSGAIFAYRGKKKGCT